MCYVTKLTKIKNKKTVGYANHNDADACSIQRKPVFLVLAGERGMDSTVPLCVNGILIQECLPCIVTMCDPNLIPNALPKPRPGGAWLFLPFFISEYCF